MRDLLYILLMFEASIRSTKCRIGEIPRKGAVLARDAGDEGGFHVRLFRMKSIGVVDFVDKLIANCSFKPFEKVHWRFECCRFDIRRFKHRVRAKLFNAD